ncbi:hypothetical protein PFISCL1PPCAC_2257, partial [Pristionchus fissidentatus]
IMTMGSVQEADAPALTFFNIAKQIPKGVKRHCGMCRQHGVVAQTRNHACPFKNCECIKCNLVRQRRSIMSMQIRLRREQDKLFVRTAEPDQAEIVPPTKPTEAPTACYFCQKCKNHGVLKWKKDHKKNCQFANCNCGQCELIDTRRALDSHIKKGKKRAHLEDDARMDADSHAEIEMCASSIASSPTVSDGRTPSLTDIELSHSLSALGYSNLPDMITVVPEMKFDLSSTVPLVTIANPSTPPTSFVSNDLLLQQLALQTTALQIPQTTIPLNPTVMPTTVSPSTITMPIDASSVTQYLNLFQPQPTILIQNPILLSLPQQTFTVSDSALPSFTPIDFQNLVRNVRGIEQLLLLNSRV